MLSVDKRQPSHLCVFVCSNTSNSNPAGVVNVEGGCACVVNTFVLDALSFNPTCPRQVTSASSMLPTTCADSPNNRMSSAKRKSNKCDIPSPKLRPRCSTRLRQRPIASCSTEQNNRGLKTHPCRTPAQISNSWLLSLLLTTWPFWFAYVICSNQIKWGETPCSLKASHNDFQSTRSKAFDKSRLTIHKGVFANNVLSITMLAVKRCSSILRFLLNPCCSSGCLRKIQANDPQRDPCRQCLQPTQICSQQVFFIFFCFRKPYWCSGCQSSDVSSPAQQQVSENREQQTQASNGRNVWCKFRTTRFWKHLEDRFAIMWRIWPLPGARPVLRCVIEYGKFAFNRWTALLIHAALQAFAASFLDQDRTYLPMLRGMAPSGANS